MSTKLDIPFKERDSIKGGDKACWTNDGPGTRPFMICECGKPINLKNAVVGKDGSVKPDLDHGCSKKGPIKVTLLEFDKH